LVVSILTLIYVEFLAMMYVIELLCLLSLDGFVFVSMLALSAMFLDVCLLFLWNLILRGLRFVFDSNNGLTFGRELDEKFEYVHAGNI